MAPWRPSLGKVLLLFHGTAWVLGLRASLGSEDRGDGATRSPRRRAANRLGDSMGGVPAGKNIPVGTQENARAAVARGVCLSVLGGQRTRVIGFTVLTFSHEGSLT